MRIYYFGELIEDTNNPNTNLQTQETQLELSFADAPADSTPAPKKTGMDSIGDILKDLDLNIDIYRPLQKVLQ